VNNNFRNADLLQKLERNPLRAPAAKALDGSEIFAGDVEYLSLNRDLSPEGRDKARRAKLKAAVRDNRDLRAPVKELVAKSDAIDKAVQMPPYDRTDVVGALHRQESRVILRTVDAGQRALLSLIPEFADALLERPPIVSGFGPNETFIVEAARKERLAGLYGPELAEKEELDKTIAEANGIFDLALVDLKLHSGMDDRAFTEFVTPIMTRRNAPWIMQSGDSVVRVRPEKRGTSELHQPATPDEIRDGKFYKSESEYLADRAA
jgi:hypothetical protein